jgi:hypothetical protein
LVTLHIDNLKRNEYQQDSREKFHPEHIAPPAQSTSGGYTNCKA